MPFISDEELNRLRSAIDIVHVVGERISLKKSGLSYKGLCPFHTEKSPSFMVNPERQIYHCFGCGEGGDAISFLMKHEGVEFVEAVSKLAESHGITLSYENQSPKEREQRVQLKTEKELAFRLTQLAYNFFSKMLHSSDGQGNPAQDYLKKRGIRESLWKESFLGFAPASGRQFVQLLQEKKAPMELAAKLGLIRKKETGEYFDFFRNRLIFSIVAADGKILGFSGRGLDDSVQPKYLNSPESMIYHKSDSLLGIHMARSAIRDKDQVILVEGNFDCLRLQQEGLLQTVAPLGTALTPAQINFLSRMTSNFVLLFDGDTAGLRAMERTVPLFLPLGLTPRVVLLPHGEDPDSFVQKNGVDGLQKMLSTATPLLDMKIELIFKREGNDPQGKARATEAIAELIRLLPGEIEKRLYIQKVADRVGVPEGMVAAYVFKKKDSFSKESNFPGQRRDDIGVEKISSLERTILEVVLSGQKIPAILFQEIEPDDFSHKELGQVWSVLRTAFQANGILDLAQILKTLSEGPLCHWITELAVSGLRMEVGSQIVTDCVAKVKAGRLKGKLKNLSHEIRTAELEQNSEKLTELLFQKNELVKQMTRLH